MDVRMAGWTDTTKYIISQLRGRFFAASISPIFSIFPGASVPFREYTFKSHRQVFAFHDFTADIKPVLFVICVHEHVVRHIKLLSYIHVKILHPSEMAHSGSTRVIKHLYMGFSIWNGCHMNFLEVSYYIIVVYLSHICWFVYSEETLMLWVLLHWKRIHLSVNTGMPSHCVVRHSQYSSV